MPEPTEKVKKIDKERILHIEKLLSKIRIKPQTLNDYLICEEIGDQEVRLFHTASRGTFWSSCAQYGSSSKNTPTHSSSIVIDETGKNYGQDYLHTTRNYICLADGHGYSGERYSCFTGIYLPTFINKDYIISQLSQGGSDNFKLIFNHLFNVCFKMDREIKKYQYMNDTVCCESQPIERALFKNKLGPKSGTTLCYSSIYCLVDRQGLKRRFIVSLNVGDSETYSVWRYPCGKVRVKVHSGYHSVENIDESQRIINRYKSKMLNVLPIYGRFNSYDKKGLLQAPFPKEVIHHIDNIPNQRTFPIYTVDSNYKATVNLETLHKIYMALGKYGEMFNIDQWYGGIQSLRTNVIEKNIDGVWKGIAPVPDGKPVNNGSTPAGLCQTTRSFGDFHNKHIHFNPHVNIIEIPDDVHVTLICQSDGYGDTVHLSEVADTINKLPINIHNQAESIKKELVKLMHNKIIGQNIRGFELDNNFKPKWDDVSLGIIDSPSLHFQE